MTLKTHSNRAILEALIRQGVISKDQAREIVLKKESLFARIKQRYSAEDGHDGAARNISLIDVMTAPDMGNAKDFFRGEIDEEEIFQALAREWQVDYVKIDPLKLDLNLVTSSIPRSFARKHLVLPIGMQGKTLTVATVNPFNQEVFDDIARATRKKIRPVLSPKSDIIKLINEFFGFKRSIAKAESYFSTAGLDIGNLEQYVQLHAGKDLSKNDRHIVNAVNHLFSYAFDQRASDIHVEPKRNTCHVRMRIDGVLHTIYQLPKNIHAAVVSRIKNMSRLDMAEKRRPQDGRIKISKGNVEVEIRISTVPVAFGEKVVMRLMDPDILMQDLDQLGFSPEDLIRFNQFIKRPHGIVLVTGPTGSGKSTTLYSALRDISSPEINITTVEDPIEMIHPDFNQIAVQPAVNITFSTILRTILRQDPDVIMIGEMRDLETAQNAVQAALTGHLVLSTLHTNDAPSSITRLLDLGVPHFLVQNTLVGIMAQRLLRKICSHCKESFEMGVEDLKSLGLSVRNETDKAVTLFRGNGCFKCRQTGYRGRTAIFEVMPYSDKLRELTGRDDHFQQIIKQSRAEGMVTLRENAVKKMIEGQTTYQEVLRVTWE